MKNISFTSSFDNINPEHLQGFFVGWKNPPMPEKLLQVLHNSTYCVLAINAEKKVIGFITAITDKTLAAYIPFLEVLPEYQKQGIGKELVTQMLKLLQGYYMIDLLCDFETQGFYEQFGMKKATGMMLRNYDK